VTTDMPGLKQFK